MARSPGAPSPKPQQPAKPLLARRQRGARRLEAEARARGEKRPDGADDGPVRRDVDAEGERVPLKERWAVAQHEARSFLWPRQTRRLSKGKAVAVLVLNVAPFPGLGTILYGKWERGLAQFLLTFVFLVGWLWALLDGVHVVQVAFHGDERQTGGGPSAH